MSYGSSVPSSHVLTRTCLIISSSRRASWSDVMKFKYADVMFTSQLFRSVQAEALAIPVSAVFTCLIFCMGFCFTGIDVLEINCRVEWTKHCFVFNYNAAFRKHRKLAVLSERHEISALCNASDAFALLFSPDIQFVSTVQQNVILRHTDRFFLSQ